MYWIGWVLLLFINNVWCTPLPNCNLANTRISNGLIASYSLNDSSNDPLSTTARNSVNTLGALSSLTLSDSSLWCTQSAGLCFQTGRDPSMGAFSAPFSPTTLGQLVASGNDFTLEIWFQQSVPIATDDNGIMWAIASWQNNLNLITTDNRAACNIYQYFGYREYYAVPSIFNTFQYLTSLFQPSVACEAFEMGTVTSNTLHQMVIVSNHASVNTIQVYLDNSVVSIATDPTRLLTNPMALFIGPSNGATCRWNGAVHFLAMYDRALSAAEVGKNFIAQLPDNPVVAQDTVLNRVQGNPFITEFNITLYDFDVNVLQCNVILGVTVLSLPKKGYLLKLIDGTTNSWDVIGLVPFNVPDLASTPLAYLPFNPITAFGSPFDSFTYQGFNAADTQPPAEPIVATGIVNIQAIDHPPVPVNATYTPFAQQKTAVFLNGTDPDISSTVPRTVVASYIITLPVNGSLCFLNSTSGICQRLKLKDLPFRLPIDLPIYYTSKDVNANMSGLNPVFGDFFLFTVTDGQLNSSLSNPGRTTLLVQNPISTFPAVNVTQQIRTQQRSRIIIQAGDVNEQDATINNVFLQMSVLPTRGTLYFLTGISTFTPITNASQVPLIPASNNLPLFYQPFLLTAGFNVDSIGFRVINGSNDFTSGVLFHFFFVNDPGIFITPNKTLNALTQVTTSFSLFWVNGAQQFPILTPSSVIPGYSSLQLPVDFTILVQSTFGTISFAHPELFRNVTLQLGSLTTPSVEIRFLATRDVLNQLISNITVTLNSVGTQVIAFQCFDLNQADNLFYLSSGTQVFQVVESNPSSAPGSSIPKWAVALLYLLAALVAVGLIIACIVASQYGDQLVKTLSTETRMQKKQDKTRQKDQRETYKLIKKQKKDLEKMKKQIQQL